jgi:hypothetical protein
MIKMPTPLKIDPVELNRLLDERTPTKEIAKYFNCSPGAVSQAKRRLGVAVVKASAERKLNPGQVVSPKKKAIDASTIAAPIIINTADDAKLQLSTLVTRCNDELKWIQDSVEQKSDSTYKGWQEIALKHVAEIRKLVSALADIEYKLHHVDIVEKALLIMFEEIGSESKECQKRIRDRLEKASILFFMDN